MTVDRASYTTLSDSELKRLATSSPPSDPAERAALADELNRRSARTRDTYVESSQAQRVTVTDIDMPFGSMVGFMVKWAIASIPALLILLLIGFVCTAFLAAIGAGLRH